MTWDYELTTRAERDFKKLPRDARDLIFDALDEFVRKYPNVNMRKLTNRPGEWRFRVGDYRVIFEIDASRQILIILKTGHRKEIY
jgi:mRNA interferase RelE/StbE